MSAPTRKEPLTPGDRMSMLRQVLVQLGPMRKEELHDMATSGKETRHGSRLILRKVEASFKL